MTVRLVLAGAGSFGSEHAARIEAMPDAELVGIADVHAPTLQRAVAAFGAAAHDTDAVALIERLRPDGVIVATPGATHLPLAEAALRLDLPVLVEKPVTATHAEALRLRDAARRSSAFVLPGHVLRFSAAHRRLAAVVRSGAIGEVLAVNSRRFRDDPHAVRYRDVDPVLTTMIHDIDLALWLSGASTARATAVRSPSGEPFRNLTTALLADDRGAAWTLSTAWTFPAGSVPPDRVEVVGTAGSVELEVGRSLTTYAAGRTERVDLTQAEPEDPLAEELVAFVAAIRSRTPPEAVTLDDAVRGLAVAEAVIAAVAAGSA